MTQYPEVFERATGERLYPGTLNVNVGERMPIKEHFRIHGKELNEPEEFQFEICRINGQWAYRIRPLDAMGGGGHGDDILEIACSKKIPNVSPGAEVEIAMFPRD
jgi:CTP-dependent riboflavin kinase